MKLLIEVNDNRLAKKILTILSVFQDEGVKVKEVEMEKLERKDSALLSDLVEDKETYTERCETLVDELRDEKKTRLEIGKNTEFLRFLYKVYKGKENISRLSDEEALEDALRDKYGL